MKLNNNKWILSFVFGLVLLILFSSNVSAWGVAPARQFADNIQTTQKLNVNIINNDAGDGYFKVSFGGALGKYANYDGGLVYLLSDQGSTNVPFTLTLPDKLEPGRNTLAVILEQVNIGSDNTVGASLTLVAEVVVNVPIDGEFVNADVVISKVSEDKPVPITISLFNTGTKTVPVWADIVIKGPTNEPLKTITTEKKILEIGKSSKFEEFWEDEKYPGNYVAEVTVYFGQSFKTISRVFTVSGEKVISEDISSKDFNLGQIVPVEISIRNNANVDVKGVYSEIFVLTKTGSIVQSFKSGPEDVLARNTATLSAYWDTSKLVVGDYDLNVLLHFEDTTTQKTYPASVSLNKLEIKNPTGQVTGDSGTSSSLSSTLILLLLILIVINVVGLVIMKKSFRKKSKK